MTSETLSAPGAQASKKKSFSNSTFMRVARYSVVRLLTLMVTVTIGVYLTILIANMGGYVDTIMKGEIRDNISQSVLANPAFRTLSPDERTKIVNDKIALEEQRLGLNQPFAVRSVRYLTSALTLNLGRAQNMISDHGSKEVRAI